MSEWNWDPGDRPSRPEPTNFHDWAQQQSEINRERLFSKFPELSNMPPMSEEEMRIWAINHKDELISGNILINGQRPWLPDYNNLEDGYSPPEHNDESTNSESSSGDWCYIATATLGSQSYLELDMLRYFRDNVIAKSAIGQELISYYRRTAPQVAKYIASRPLLKSSFLIPFINPSLKLLKRKENLLRDTIVFAIFLSGLAWASILRIFVSSNRSD
jgi:hypothetical protein